MSTIEDYLDQEARMIRRILLACAVFTTIGGGLVLGDRLAARFAANVLTPMEIVQHGGLLDIAPYLGLVLAVWCFIWCLSWIMTPMRPRRRRRGDS